MKCKLCGQEIKLCEVCKDNFTIGDICYCFMDEHFCSKFCILDILDIKDSEVIE
jgi:hypothetical protein